MASLGFELLARFLWGSLFLLTFISRTETSERFPRIAAWIASGVAVFATSLLLSSGDTNVKLLLSMLCFTLGALLYGNTTSQVGRISGFFLHTFLAPALILQGKDFGSYINFIFSGLVFGSVYCSQYLGHWYLTVPGMHIRELVKMTKLIFVSLLLKTSEILFTLFVVLTPSDKAPPVTFLGQPLGLDVSNPDSITHLNPVSELLGIRGSVFWGLGVFGVSLFVMRILWGIVAPLIMAYLIQRTAEVRSTQSATGILYALSVLIIIGEASALFLKFQLGWNL